jgi:hypothetical protein
LLRDKNKELERKHTEEKLARETAEAKVKSLKKKIRELKEQLPEGATAPEGIAKFKKTNEEENAYGDEKKSGEAYAAISDSYTAIAERPSTSQAPQQGTKRLPRTSSLSPKREVGLEERYGSKDTQPPPKIANSMANPNFKSMATLPVIKDATKEGKRIKSRESNNTSGTRNTAGNVDVPAKQSLASSPRNNTDQQSMTQHNIDAALNAFGGGGQSQGRIMGGSELKPDSSMPPDLGQLQHVQQPQLQQPQPQPQQMRMSHINYDSDSGTNAPRSLATGSIPTSIQLRTSSIGRMDAMTLPMPGSAAPAAPAVATTVSFDPLGAPPDRAHPDQLGAMSGPQVQHQQHLSAAQGQISLGVSGGGGGHLGMSQQGSNASMNAMNHGPSQPQPQPQQQVHWGKTQTSHQQQQWMGQQAANPPLQAQQVQSQSTAAYDYQQQMSAPPVHSQSQQAYDYQQHQIAPSVPPSHQQFQQNIADNSQQHQQHFQQHQAQPYVPGAQAPQGFQSQQQSQNATSGMWNNQG